MSDDNGYLRFLVDGQKTFIQWLTILQTEKLINQDDHPVMLEHLAKYRSLMPSLALIFHLVEAADRNERPGPVSDQAARMAAAWCQYLESHARRIYGLATDPALTSAAKLADTIAAGKLGKNFKARDVQMKKWGMLTKKQQVTEAIEYLITEGWLRETFSESTGYKAGRPATAATYLVNPKIFTRHTK